MRQEMGKRVSLEKSAEEFYSAAAATIGEDGHGSG